MGFGMWIQVFGLMIHHCHLWFTVVVFSRCWDCSLLQPCILNSIYYDSTTQINLIDKRCNTVYKKKFGNFSSSIIKINIKIGCEEAAVLNGRFRGLTGGVAVPASSCTSKGPLTNECGALRAWKLLWCRGRKPVQQAQKHTSLSFSACCLRTLYISQY